MSEITVGLVGAGYIATWHLDALMRTAGVKVTAICDVSEAAAKGMAEGYGLQAFTSVEDLITSGTCQMVHILTPPHLHEPLAIQCMEGGLDVLVEKPVAEGVEATRRMAEAAERTGQRFHAGHNFLGLPSYQKMKAEAQAGGYGRISSVDIVWALPLAPLRSGPYGIWLMREPKNLLLELGPHPYAFAKDLLGEIEILSATASYPVALPGEDSRPQGFRVMARAGGVDVNFTLTMVEVIDDRSVTLRGSSGLAKLDYAADTLVVERENTQDLIVNPLLRQLGKSWEHTREGFRNAFIQTKSLNTRSPYGQSFRGMDEAIYGDIAAGKPVDDRFSAQSAVSVMQALDDTLAKLDPSVLEVKAPAVQTRKPAPSAMVIGGTGFIGRELTRKLVAEGRDVRVLSRGRTGPFPDLPDQVETVGVSLYDSEGLKAAMEGIDVVFNLARSMEDTWEAALKNDVGVAVGIGEAALSAGVKRLVYTGTIASYDMSDPAKTITETTAFPADMTNRNMYARSKAECERQLLEMHKEKGLPLVIARPGIVVGPGGPLQHWGIGRWHGAGAVKIWGAGKNILPFVLNEDIADGLVRMIDADVEGKSFNLTGEPMLTGKDYFEAVEATLGSKMRVTTGNLNAFYAADALKYGLKKYALRKPGVIRPSLADWQSRAHYSPFDNRRPKELLGWAPEADRAEFIRRGITDAGLFGL